MTPGQIEQEVLELIDNRVDHLSTEEYADFLSALIGSLEAREESVREELDE